MTINDLLAPNETVQLSGTVTSYGEKSTDIYLTNQCLYLYCEELYKWEVQRYDCIVYLTKLWIDGKWHIQVYNSNRFNSEFDIGRNSQWADSIFKCLKHGWDDAKRHASTGTTGGDGNPFGW